MGDLPRRIDDHHHSPRPIHVMPASSRVGRTAGDDPELTDDDVEDALEGCMMFMDTDEFMFAERISGCVANELNDVIS